MKVSSPTLFSTGFNYREFTVSLLTDVELTSCIAVIIKRVDLIGQAAFPGTLMYLLNVAWIYVYISVIL